MGILRDIEYDDEGTPETLCIELDHSPPGTITRIGRYSARFEVAPGIKRSRTQFPVIVAEAVTSYKAQSVTKTNVIADFSSCFKPCMA